MSEWSRIAQDGVDAVFGAGATIKIVHPKGRVIIWVWRHSERQTGTRDVLAIAGGDDPVAAWRMLLQVLYRDDHRLTTAEVAQVLGVTPGRVRQLVMGERLVADDPGGHSRSARFTAAEVYHMTEIDSYVG